MKYKSQVYTQASGSVGGLTYSHNKGGLYTRARSIPTNPSTPQQQAIRAAMATLTTRWTNTLTQAQRDGWDVYAGNVPRTDALGEPRQLSGLNWYVACNSVRITTSSPVIDIPPTIFLEASLTPPTIATATAATDILSVGFNNTDAWATAAGGHLLVYTSPPQSAGVVFYKGPYRFAGQVTGAAIPPTSPAAITAAFPFAIGNKVFAQFRANLADGRISPSFRLGAVGI